MNVKNKTMNLYRKTKIMFSCHGNICRSPMAQFVAMDIAKKMNVQDRFFFSSSATSTDALGQGIHPSTKQKLKEHGILFENHTAVQMTKKDYEDFDLIIVMDSLNKKNMLRLLGGDPEKKIHLLLEYASDVKEEDLKNAEPWYAFIKEEDLQIADPWYTLDFDSCFFDIQRGCKALLEFLCSK